MRTNMQRTRLQGGLAGGSACYSPDGRAGWRAGAGGRHEPLGPDDEIGRLNLMTPESRAAILSRVDGSAAYDLSVEYFVGMPSWQALGDPRYQFWMTHTPNGTVVDDPNGQGRR